eukprot:1814969-Amphidinium_carterae.1
MQPTSSAERCITGGSSLVRAKSQQKTVEEANTVNLSVCNRMLCAFSLVKLVQTCVDLCLQAASGKTVQSRQAARPRGCSRDCH